MDITAILKAVLAPREGQAKGADWSSLETGDQFSARVLKLENDGRVLIDLGGSRALAQTSMPVRQGQVLQLEVVKTGQPLHLRVLPDNGETAARPVPQMDLDGVLSHDDQQRITGLLERIVSRDRNAPDAAKLPETVKQAVTSLKTLFESVSVEKDSGEIASDLRVRLEDRGLFFEKKLADAVLARPETPGGPQVRGGNTPVSQPLALARPQAPGSTPGPVQPTVAEDGGGAPVNPAAQAPAAEPSPAALSPLTSQGTGQTTAILFETGALTEQKVPGTEVQESQTGDPLLAGKEQAAKIPDHPSPQEKSSLSLFLMRDLKAQLLVLQSYLSETAGPDSSSDKELAFLGRQVQKLLAHVGRQQDHVVQRADQGEPFQVVAHWVALEEQTRPVKLKVYYPRKNKAGQAGQYHRVSLLLDMDRLGMVRVDLACLDKHLSIDFYVDREESRLHIEQHQDKVLQALGPDFFEVQVSVKVSKEKIATFDSEDQGSAAVGRIDIKA